MTEWRMSKIVRQRQRLGQILIQTKTARHAAGDLSHFDAVSQSGSKVIAMGGNEDLRLMFQAPKSGRVDDPVAVALETTAAAAFGFGMQPTAAIFRPRRKRRWGLQHGCTISAHTFK
jgi:hypothetical protein